MKTAQISYWTVYWTEAAYGERWSFTHADFSKVRHAAYELGGKVVPGSVHFIPTYEEPSDA